MPLLPSRSISSIYLMSLSSLVHLLALALSLVQNLQCSGKFKVRTLKRLSTSAQLKIYANSGIRNGSSNLVAKLDSQLKCLLEISNRI